MSEWVCNACGVVIMCGIFGVCSYCSPCTMEELVVTLVNGLRRLEYRGYDSAGLCVDVDGQPTVVRRTGNVQALYDAAVTENIGKIPMDAKTASHAAISHTRWATHGPPCDKNAHPQSSGSDNEFVVVHNGIMTNFREMKTFLEGKGHKFVSDTDTEVVAALAAYLYHEQSRDGKVTFAEIAMEVMKLTEGACAFAFVSKHFPGELVACKRGSPLIIGIKNRGASQGVKTVGHALGASSHDDGPCDIFVASDVSPIAEHTKQVVYLDDGDVVSVKDGKVHFFNLARAESQLLGEVRAVKELELELEALTKGNYAHFMLKEIFEQVETVVSSMRGRVNWDTSEVKMGGFMKNKRLLKTARRLLFISCGTSLNACIAVRPLFDELVGVPTAVENASDFLDRKPKVFRDDVCIFVSQSGETADTLRAMEHCREYGSVLVGFTNTVGSAISRQTDFGAHLNCGPEIGVASTKAFTSQIVTLTLMALMLCDDSIELKARRAEILKGLNSLSSDVANCLQTTEPLIRDLAERMFDAKSVLVLGRGYQFATSLEAALKIKELSYIHTEGLNAGELKHGPLALIDENIVVIIICTKDALIERVRAAVQQIRARNGKPIVLLSEADPEVEELADTVVRVPQTTDCLQSIVNVVPLQLLAYHTACKRGNNVDCPRNLAKSVTVQ